jgi:hypothetical protein
MFDNADRPRTGRLTRTVLPQATAYAPPRAAAAAIRRSSAATTVSVATTIAVYLKKNRHARKSSCDGQSCQTRTTQHYERRRDEVILDKVERIAI